VTGFMPTWLTRAHRLSPIQVLTQQCTAGSQTPVDHQSDALTTTLPNHPTTTKQQKSFTRLDQINHVLLARSVRLPLIIISAYKTYVLPRVLPIIE